MKVIHNILNNIRVERLAKSEEITNVKTDESKIKTTVLKKTDFKSVSFADFCDALFYAKLTYAEMSIVAKQVALQVEFATRSVKTKGKQLEMYKRVRTKSQWRSHYTWRMSTQKAYRLASIKFDKSKDKPLIIKQLSAQIKDAETAENAKTKKAANKAS